MKIYSVTDFTSTLAETTDAASIWQATTTFFGQYELDGLVYLDADGGDFTLHSTLPESWHQHYIDSRYHEIDPFAEICCASYQSVSTGAKYLHLHPHLSQKQQQLVREASETGYKTGFSSTFRIAGDRGFGGWNFLSSDGDKTTRNAAKAHGDVLHLAAFCAHQALANAPDLTDIQLSDRETECLQWLASGLRTQNIAFKMGIKPVTVEFHFRRAREKLGANTREQALAKAILAGVLSI